MADKLYIDAEDLLLDSFRLGERILASGFRPSFILALWRGAAPIGIAVQEYLAWHGIASAHIAVRTASYSGIDNQSREIAIYGISYLLKNVSFDDRLLTVADVYDTGRTIEAIIDELRRKTRRNAPHDIRIAVPWYKPARNQTDLIPHYYLHETDRWLKFPHSLEGLSDEEIRANRPRLHEILENAKPQA